MATNFGEKYGIENYNIKLKNQNDAIKERIKSCLSYGNFTKIAVNNFIDDMNGSVSLNKDTLSNYLNEYLNKNFKGDMDQWYVSCEFNADTGYNVSFKKFFNNTLKRGNESNDSEGYCVPSRNLFSNLSLVIDFTSNGHFCEECENLNKFLGIKEEDFFEFSREVLNSFLYNNLRQSIQYISDENLWGPINKKMLEDMLYNREIYKEYMSQFKLFTEVK